MFLSEQLELINKIEIDFPVDTWIINEIHIWPLIRILLGSQLAYDQIEKPVFKKNYINKKIHAMAYLIKGILGCIKAYLLDYSNNASLHRKVDAIFLSNSFSRVKLNTTWYDRLCDPFIAALNATGRECLYLELLHSYRIPRFSPGVFIQHSLDLLLLIRIFSFRKNSKMRVNLPYYEEFRNILKANNIIFSYTLDQLVQITYGLRLSADFFKKIFKRTNPQMGFVVNYYGLEGMAFNLACREMGIFSIDIQHGVQGDFHFAYGRWKRIPELGYELLPNLFWVWSNLEYATITDWNQTVDKWHQPFTGGNLWLNFWINDDNGLFLNFKKQVNNIKNFSESKIKILLTLQPDMPNYGIPSWLIETIDHSPSDWFWLIRLHPGMLNNLEKIKQLLNNCSNRKYNIDDATNLPLPSILSCVDVHVTHSSSTVIEAQLFQVPSIVFSEMGKELYAEQFKTGWLEVVSDEIALLAMINYQYEKRSTLKKPDSGNKDILNIQDLLSFASKYTKGGHNSNVG